MIKGSCHCGNVTFSVPRKPEWLTECNCSICRRVGALWAHFPVEEAKIFAAPGSTIAYVQGDKTLAAGKFKDDGVAFKWG